MAQKVELVFYHGPRAEKRIAYAHVFEDMAAACAFYPLGKALWPAANVAFVGQDFAAALAGLKERIAA